MALVRCLVLRLRFVFRSYYEISFQEQTKIKYTFPILQEGLMLADKFNSFYSKDAEMKLVLPFRNVNLPHNSKVSTILLLLSNYNHK